MILLDGVKVKGNKLGWICVEVTIWRGEPKGFVEVQGMNGLKSRFNDVCKSVKKINGKSVKFLVVILILEVANFQGAFLSI